jgi:hypothetical protein
MGEPSIAVDAEVRARFWANVDRRTPDECWPWIGAKRGTRTIVGCLRVGNASPNAPRISLYLDGRDPPDGKPLACHTCDNPICVNPRHLWWGSNTDNMRDASAKGRCVGQDRTHCPRGHLYTPENTYRRPEHRNRHCRACKALCSRNYRRRMALSKQENVGA